MQQSRQRGNSFEGKETALLTQLARIVDLVIEALLWWTRAILSKILPCDDLRSLILIELHVWSICSP